MTDETEYINDFDDLPEGDGVLVVSPQGRVLSSNLQAERILKIRLNRGQAIRMDQLISDQYLPQAELALREALQAGHSRSNLVAAVRLESGLPLSVTWSVTPLYDGEERIIGLILTFRDMTTGSTRPAVSDRMIGVEYDTLFENLAEGVFSINTRWRITSFNFRAQEITGFKREEVLGRHCWDVFKSDLCKSACPLKVTLETGVTHVDQDVRILAKHGRRLSILVNTAVMRDRRDNVVGAVETFRPLSLPAEGMERLTSLSRGQEEIIGSGPALSRLLEMLPDVAASDASVILEGESGTGKELFARAIHTRSPRASGPFVAVNCSALAETLLESELFGHEKAAFTGATSSRVGRFELARAGTLFLDEIAEIRPELQVKLLRVLEERVFERVGGTRPITMDARIISATNRRLVREVRAGRFREDLFFRLRTVPLSLPPLRERPEDLAMLTAHFVERLNATYGKSVRGVDPKVMARFERYAWPGNIRELQRVLEYAFVFVKGPVITPAQLPDLEDGEPDVSADGKQAAVGEVYWQDERDAIARALKKAGGRRQEAARSLGISRSSLWRKMKAHGLK